VKRSTHLAVGAAVVAPLALSQEPVLAVATVWFGLAGAVLPDWIDFRSDFRQPLRLKHRGVSHSLAALAVCTAAAWFLTTVVERQLDTIGMAPSAMPANAAGVLATALALGFGSHLLADACTPSGIGPLLPFSSRRWWLLPSQLRGRTGGVLDAVTRSVAVTVAAFALVIAAGRWLDLLA